MKLFVCLLAVTVLTMMLVPAQLCAENQPHMRAALEHLQAAKAELEKASHDKGGHRTEAMKHTDEAIKHVQAGISYDNAHESKKEEMKEHKH